MQSGPRKWPALLCDALCIDAGNVTGAADGTRTRKPVKAADFKSAESTNFSTAARQGRYCGVSAAMAQALRSAAILWQESHDPVTGSNTEE